LLCILKADGSCVSSKVPRTGASYNRISVLAITDSNDLPSTAQGFDRLVATKSFNPLLVPVAGKSKKSDKANKEN
jgi:hypothetical protein